MFKQMNYWFTEQFPTSFSVFLTAFTLLKTFQVLNFHHRGPFDRPVPEWIRVLVLQKLRSFLKMHLQYPLNNNGAMLVSNGLVRKLSTKKAIG